MELRHLRYFVAVAEELHFARAARRLHMSAPPLSQRIKELERRLGVELFTRNPRSVTLTPAGERVLDHARAILAAADALPGALDRAVEATQVADLTRLAERCAIGRVRVGYTVSTAFVEMPKLIGAAAGTPGVEIDGCELWDAALDEALSNGRLDAALGRGLPHRPATAYATLRREPYVVVVGSTHRLAAREAVSLRELRGQTLRFFPRHLAPTYHEMVLAALDATGEVFEVWETPVPGLRHLGVRDGDGFSLLPASIREWLPKGVAAVSVLDDLPTIDLELLWRPDHAPPGVALLVDTALDLARRADWRNM